MKLKKLGMLALSATFVCFLASCDFKTKNETPTTSDTTTVVVTDPVSDPEPQVDNKYKIFLLAQSSGFNGTYEEWLESIKGDSVVITVIDGKLKWKYSNEANYKELLDLNTLKGKDGSSSVITIGENGNWFIDGEDTLVKARATDGNGIVSVTKKGTSGLIDTYTITFTDGSETEFSITNGQDGTTTTITKIEKTDSEGLVDTYTITFSDSSYYNFYVTNGKDGEGSSVQDGKLFRIKDVDGKVYRETITCDYDDELDELYGIMDVLGEEFLGKWIPRYRDIYDYREGKIYSIDHSICVRYYPIEDWDYIGNEVFEYNNNSITTIYNNWENNDDVPYKKEVVEESNNTKTLTSYAYSNNTWTPEKREVTEFNLNGNVINTIYYKWSTDVNDWVGDYSNYRIVEYSDNGLTKIVYVYSDDSVEKIISAYTRNGWVNQTRVVSTFRTDGVALGTEQVEDREYNWNISEEKWVDTNIVTCYEYSLDGHKLLTKTVYEDDDSVMLLIHVYNYDINGNIIRDYYLKEATGNQFFKYGIEKVYSEELHCNTEVHYYWDGAEGIDIAKGKTTSYLYQFGSNVPFKYVELYYDITYDTSTHSYQYELTKCIEQNCDEFGTLIGESAEKTLDYGSYVYFSSTPEYKMVIGNFETTYSGSYAFDMNALLIVPNSYNIDSGNVYTGDLLDKYYYTEYDLYSHTYRRATIRKPIVEEGIVVGASIDKYYNGEFVEKDCYVSYTHNELGLLVEQIWSYDWDNDLEKWTRFEKVEITWNANRKPTTIIGYNKVGENWVESFKTVQTWENDEIIEVINYSWDPTANGGLGDWVQVTL